MSDQDIVGSTLAAIAGQTAMFWAQHNDYFREQMEVAAVLEKFNEEQRHKKRGHRQNPKSKAWWKP